MLGLRIVRCDDPLMWYAGLVGSVVPYCGMWPGEGYRSRETAGHINIVMFGDAVICRRQ